MMMLYETLLLILVSLRLLLLFVCCLLSVEKLTKMDNLSIFWVI